MKKFIFFLTVMFISITVSAQVPYFAGTEGDGNLYGYTSLKFRPGVNNQETYTCIRYGIGNHFSTGMDLYTGVGSTYFGYSVRGNAYKSKYFGIGGQYTASFNLNDSHKYSYSTLGLYMNGAIYDNLFWCSNTWWGANRDNTHSLNQWTYLGYAVDFEEKGSLTPMAGYILNTMPAGRQVTHDLAIGAYYTYKMFDFYLWCDKFIAGAPRLVIGVDYTFNCK